MPAAKVFFDTNILVYCFDQENRRKQRIAEMVVMEKATAELGVVSYQVKQEFVSVAIRKLKDVQGVRRMVANYDQLAFGLHSVVPSDALFRRAIDLWERYALSWYESLIVSAALAAHCTVLYTEDMQNGLEIDGVRIVNPFV